MEANNYNYGIKSTIAQCFAVTGVNLLQICVGSEVMTSTVVIGALKFNMENSVNSTLHEHDDLKITNDQASWFGSLLYLCTPLGSFLSSLLLSRFGHKKCLIVTNVPCLISLIMLGYAENVFTLYVCSILMGLSIGFTTGPCFSYTGEICEPKLRGTLCSAINVFYYAGSLVFTVIYGITKQWRLTLLISAIFPILNIFILLMTPDSPMWLLTRGKTEKARQTLCKLRGKISNEKCASEFEEMVGYASVNSPNQKEYEEETSPWEQIFQPEVLRPFRLLMVYFVFAKLLNGIQYAPYLVEVFTKFGAPVSVEWTVSFSVFLSILGSIMTVLFLNKLGKRFLSLSTMFICSVCYISIGLIGNHWPTTGSFTSWLILVLFLVTTITSSFGILSISWILLTELFPMKSRNITCNISTALSYIISFILTKYYPDFASFVDFYNTFTIFGVGGLFCCVYIYFCLPETENKTLQEISEFFK